MTALPSVATYIHEPAKEAALELTVKFRNKAFAYGWPQSVIKNLSVEYRNGAYEIVIPPDLSVVVDDLEYGTPTSSPMRVIKSFMEDEMVVAENNLGDLTTDFMFDSGDLP